MFGLTLAKQGDQAVNDGHVQRLAVSILAAPREP